MNDKRSKPTPMQYQMLNYIQAKGHVTTEELIQVFGISERLVRRSVAKLVDWGEPIDSSRANGGYHFCDTPEQLETAKATAKKMISKWQRRLRGLNKANNRVLHGDNNLYLAN